MKHSAKKFLALLVLSGLIVAALSGVALAGPPWSDASATWWQTNYGVSEAAVATVADGFPDGTFRPTLAVTRGQFAKMAVSGLGVDTAHPATATFSDVIPSNSLYDYIEGAYKAEIIGGIPSGTGLLFKPTAKITRQQANSILGRYLSGVEIDVTGTIHGDVNNYGTLQLWYNAEGSFYLNAFTDASKVAADHRPGTAYLIFRKIVEGSNSRLNPTNTLNRAQAAAMILRVKAEEGDIKTPPGAPSNLALIATPSGEKQITYNSATKQYVGNDPTPQVTGDTLASRPIAIYDGGTKLVEDTSNSAGKFYTDITAALSDGTHTFTAKVKNENGLVSAASPAITYLLDTVAPTATITKPAASGALPVKPDFAATVTDSGTGVKQVEFQVAVKATTPAWQTVYIDTAPDTGTATYAAVWPTTGALSSGLADGTYQFRAVATDNAGNQRTSSVVEGTVDLAKPVVQITTPVSSTIFYTEDASPTFIAAASDPGQASGIASVSFYYAPYSADNKPTTWSGFSLISTDTTAEYAAVWGSAVLPEGRYILAVKAVDTTGNESALMNGSAYAAGVTQEILVDYSAPKVTVTAPYAGQVLGESQAVNILWTLSDTTAPASVKIEYTLDYTASPEWHEIAATTSNDGSYTWTTPEVSGAKANCRIRVTAVDLAGPLVGDVIGHTTQALSGQFKIDDTVFELPAAVTALVAEDADEAEPGVNGLDFHATWVLSTSTNIASQKIYILPSTVNFLDLSAHIPVQILGNAATSWTGLASLTKDSANNTLTWGDYRIWIVVTDTNERSNTTKSAAFEVHAES